MFGRQRLLLGRNQIEALVLRRTRLFHICSLLIFEAVVFKIVVISLRPPVVLASLRSLLIIVEHWLLAFKTLLLPIFQWLRREVVFDPSTVVGLRVSEVVV